MKYIISVIVFVYLYYYGLLYAEDVTRVQNDKQMEEFLQKKRTSENRKQDKASMQEDSGLTVIKGPIYVDFQ